MTDPVNRPVRMATGAAVRPMGLRSLYLPAVAGLAALGLLLAGCSDEGGDGESSSASPSATEVATSSESPSASGPGSESPSTSPSGSYEPATETSPAKNVPVPEMPEAVKEPTEEGLEALVSYWFDTDYYLKSTGDPGPMSVASNENCGFCQDLIANWPPAYDEGAWAVVEPAVVSIQVVNVDNGGTGGTMAFQVTEESGRLYDASGVLVEEASSDVREDVQWTGSAVYLEDAGHWQVENLRTSS